MMPTVVDVGELTRCRVDPTKKSANGSAATRTVQLVHIYVPYVLWLKDQATRKGAVSVPTLRRLWTVSDSFKLR